MTSEEIIELAHSFMRAVPTRRLYLAKQLGLEGDLPDTSVRDFSIEILRRVRAQGKIEQLAKLMAK